MLSNLLLPWHPLSYPATSNSLALQHMEWQWIVFRFSTRLSIRIPQGNCEIPDNSAAPQSNYIRSPRVWPSQVKLLRSTGLLETTGRGVLFVCFKSGCKVQSLCLLPDNLNKWLPFFPAQFLTVKPPVQRFLDKITLWTGKSYKCSTADPRMRE